MLAFIRREPAVVVGLVVAVITLVVAFGIPITPDQKAAIVGVVGAALSLLGAGVTRSRVTPVKAPKNEAGEIGLPQLVPIMVLATLVLVVLLFIGVHG